MPYSKWPMSKQGVKLLDMRKPDITQLQLTIGARIKERRKVLGITQERLSELSGLSTNFIATIEIGQKTPSLETLVKLSRALGVEPCDLLRTEPGAEEVRISEYVENSLQGLPPMDVKFTQALLRFVVDYFKQKAEEHGDS
ncbi:MAG TPA: hypothetical protein DCL60_12400 [Armatimonadetes bacterium]|nr:hypothetical protein [Armatimonadota bacterium]